MKNKLLKKILNLAKRSSWFQWRNQDSGIQGGGTFTLSAEKSLEQNSVVLSTQRAQLLSFILSHLPNNSTFLHESQDRFQPKQGFHWCFDETKKIQCRYSLIFILHLIFIKFNLIYLQVSVLQSGFRYLTMHIHYAYDKPLYEITCAQNLNYSRVITLETIGFPKNCWIENWLLVQKSLGKNTCPSKDAVRLFQFIDNYCCISRIRRCFSA